MTPIEWGVVIIAVGTIVALLFSLAALFGKPGEDWVRDQIQSKIDYHEKRNYAHLPMRQGMERDYDLTAAGPGWSIRNADKEDRAHFEKLFREGVRKQFTDINERMSLTDMRLDAIEFAIDPDEFTIRAEDI